MSTNFFYFFYSIIYKSNVKTLLKMHTERQKPSTQTVMHSCRFYFINSLYVEGCKLSGFENTAIVWKHALFIFLTPSELKVHKSAFHHKSASIHQVLHKALWGYKGLLERSDRPTPIVEEKYIQDVLIFICRLRLAGS